MTAITAASRQRQHPMVVAMAAVRVVQMAIDQIVDMVAMRHGFMAATGPMDMAGGMAGARMVRRASDRIGRRRFDMVFIDMIAVQVMQMPVMQIIDMALVADGGMAAGRAMLVGMLVVMGLVAGRHGLRSLGKWSTATVFNGMVDGVLNQCQDMVIGDRVKDMLRLAP